jgi:hypothetical protein
LKPLNEVEGLMTRKYAIDLIHKPLKPSNFQQELEFLRVTQMFF